MSSLLYLSLLKAKNKAIEIIKTPSQLILVLVFVFFVLFSFFGPKSEITGQSRSIDELYAIIFVFYSFSFVMTSKKGFHNGASMFTMADVNILFTAPFKSTSVLGFGLAQQLTRSALLGLFILYQSETLRQLYGAGASAIFFIFTGYVFTVLLSQMTAMLIYSFTSSDDKKRNLVKGVYYSAVGVFIAAALYISYMSDGISLASLTRAVNSKLFILFPVSGVIKAGVEGAMEGQYLHTLFSFFAVVLLVGVYYLIICRVKTDYYDDVLCATETSFSAVTARKEGKVADDAPRNVKVGKTGFTKGIGASSVYYKHKTENRRGKVFLLSMSSLVFIALSAVYSFLFKDVPVSIFVLNAYLLMFSVASSRWAKELNYPYIYLIPEPPIKKLFYMLLADFPSLVIESILCFLPVYFFAKLSSIEALAMALGRVSLGILITGVNFILQRLIGSSERKVLIFTVYFLLISLFSLPGTVLATLTGMALPFNAQYAYFVFSMVNILVSAVIFFCTRNVLEYSEYNNR